MAIKMATLHITVMLNIVHFFKKISDKLCSLTASLIRTQRVRLGVVFGIVMCNFDARDLSICRL
jgi:hypothetical protein